MHLIVQNMEHNQVHEVYVFCVVLVDLCEFVGYSITCKNDA
jgi:hypothetical protein